MRAGSPTPRPVAFGGQWSRSEKRKRMNAEQVVELYGAFLANGISVWLCGGWGVDALLQEQTRPHEDLDIIIRAQDVVAFLSVVSSRGFYVAEIWSGNRWLVGSDDVSRPTAFVVQGGQGLKMDVHAAWFDAAGNAGC